MVMSSGEGTGDGGVVGGEVGARGTVGLLLLELEADAEAAGDVEVDVLDVEARRCKACLSLRRRRGVCAPEPVVVAREGRGAREAATRPSTQTAVRIPSSVSRFSRASK